MKFLVEDGKVRGKLQRVPNGFTELLSDISREVIRCRPHKECMVQFIIDYVKAIIVGEEKISAVDRIMNRAWIPLNERILHVCLCQMTQETREPICTVMADCFNSYLNTVNPPFPLTLSIWEFQPYQMINVLLDRCSLSDEDKKNNRAVVELNYEKFAKYYVEEHKDDTPPDKLCRYIMEHAEMLKRYHRCSRAAVLIQTHYRGYLVRRCVFLKYLRFTDSEMELAAFKIQRYYRDYRKKSLRKVEGREPMPIDQEFMRETSRVCGIFSLMDMDPKIDYDYVLLRRRRHQMMAEEEGYDKYEKEVNKMIGRGASSESSVGELDFAGEEEEEQAKAASAPVSEAAAGGPVLVLDDDEDAPVKEIESADSLVEKKSESEELSSSSMGDYEGEMEGEFEGEADAEDN